MKTVIYLSFSLIILTACSEAETDASREIPNPSKRSLPNPEGAAKDKFEDEKHLDSIPVKTLKGTTWNSEFYHYHNFYHFKTDSTGYSDDGQVAWSTPIDLKKNKIPEDKILYNGERKFKYRFHENKLIITYLDSDHDQHRIFLYRKEYKDWISKYEYTYGNEVLQPGKKAEMFTAVQMIEK